MGQLKFRTSYGQNQHAHAIETAHIAGMIAMELGADVNIAKAGGLLHDIGKAIDHNVEGTHALIGAEFVKRYGGKDAVVNCIAAIITKWRKNASKPSSSRRLTPYPARAPAPGARASIHTSAASSSWRRSPMDSMASNRAMRCKRGARCASSCGRKWWTITPRFNWRAISPSEIENDMQYPGQIKVHVIRETRRVEYAK